MQGNPDLAKRLADNIPGVELDAHAYRWGHGIEVQLPFIHRLTPNARITAIVLAVAEYTGFKRSSNSYEQLF